MGIPKRNWIPIKSIYIDWNSKVEKTFELSKHGVRNISYLEEQTFLKFRVLDGDGAQQYIIPWSTLAGVIIKPLDRKPK